MLEIARPRVQQTHSGVNYGRFVIEPLEPGYGITIGNALRRILLRSLPGAAIVRVRISDVWHEFSTIDGMREDVTEIVLNLKRVRLRAITPEFKEARASLYAQGEGVVRSGDVDWPGDLEPVNPDFVIATLDSADAHLEMDLVVQRGRGYQPAEAQEIFAIGDIPVDAIFTPIEKVNYVVEHTRIGQMTDYDRLILEIVTDGTIEPDDALTQAADILVEHARLIAEYNHEPVLDAGDLGVGLSEADSRPLSELGLSPRVLNALRSRQIEKIGQVLALERDQLMSIRNFGPRSLQELREQLEAHGYHLDLADATAAGAQDEDEDEFAEAGGAAGEDDAGDESEETPASSETDVEDADDDDEEEGEG
ncbi:MAG TPA: DNA-directed RNA polymerase subunit alpha [Thermomicrobiaceae bacterium]|nr:DNA-directed RNA polymerase subunit alpha [Thermomicrobiaceae bacterium]